MTLQLAIVLPTYNERGNLQAMVERLDNALAGIEWEAIVVDDNSPDGTADEARALAREDHRLRVLSESGGAGCRRRRSRGCAPPPRRWSR